MLKEHIKEQTGKEEIDLNEYIEIRNKNYWETLWSEASKYSPIRLVCVCEKINLDPDKMEKLMESIPSPVFAYFKYEGEDAENAKKRISMELKRLREFAKKYDPKYQFYEFAILMEFLKMKRKIISEEPRINTDPIFLKDILIIKDKRVFCSVCHVRPAVTFYTEKVRKKLPMIKEGERLCPVCLTKRMLATLRFREEGKVDEDSPLIRIILEVFKWIDGTEDGSKYAKALQKAAKIYYERFSKVYYNAAKMYYGEFPKVDTQLSSPFIIPSLDSISTLLFRISAMRVLDSSEATRFLGLINDFTKQLYKPKTEEESIEMILRDFPSIKLIEIENLSTNLPLYFVGGEWLIKEEIERMARDHGIKLDENKLKEYEDILKSVGEKVEKHKYSNAIARRPGKYVALIRGDGDNMGKLLSLTGKYLKKVHEVIPLELKEYLERDKYEKLSNFVYFATPSYYSMSSRVLSIIAKKISEISDEYYTMMIYSGGDDVLAFSTPETSLQFCYHARKLFSQNYIEINDETLFKSEIIVPGLTENATQSYSIHLMHVFTPVSINLLDSLIELNEYAKEGGKNSFVLSYVPRGGGGVLTKLPWYIKGIVEYLMNFISITLDFPTMIRLEDKKIIKSKLKVSHRAYRDFIEICEVNEGLSKDVTRSLFEYEIKRHMINDKIEELYKIIPMDQIYCFPIEIKGNVSNLAIELAKASIILRDSMDSNPIMFSEKL
jgi:CRISPR-associated protein Cas10/Cmr2 subtype III-B